MRALAALAPAVLGLPHGGRVARDAAGRLDDFVRALPQDVPRRNLRLLVDFADALALFVHSRGLATLKRSELDELVELIFDSDEDWPDNLLAIAGRVFGDGLPSMRDIARALLELCSIAVYSVPKTAEWTGFVPLWKQPEALKYEPTLADDHRWLTPDRRRLDWRAIVARHEEGADRPADAFFAGDGRPRVAIIGSGAGGATVAARLAGRFDVAVFEAGPRMAIRERPTDVLAAQALCYERGLLYPTADLDVRVLAGRVVGGGSAVNEGVSVRPRKSTLDSWQRGGVGFDRALLERALNAVEKRQRFAPYADDVLTDPSHRFAEGARRQSGIVVERLISDIATHEWQHGDRPGPEVIGPKCIGCGLCNHGCPFGHHLSVDRTFLVDAEAAGARVHPNTPVHHLVPQVDRATGDVRVVGLRLERAPGGETIPVDAVVLCAGAMGSPMLLARSARRRPSWRRLPAFSADLVGAGLGFNYGTGVVARWASPHERPGKAGIQVAFIATKPGDESFIIENGWITPPIISSLIPAVGAEHRRLMGSLDSMGLAVNTIGSHSDGRVDHAGNVRFRVGRDAMGTIQESLAAMVGIYLHGGAVEVRMSGLRSTDDSKATFDPSWRGRDRAILQRIREVVQGPEHVALSSGHPQGGLHMNADPRRGAVDGDFRVHGSDNLFVADASLFPTTITVNPQWLVMALGWSAGDRIAEQLGRGRTD